jgi:hypothetical protein
MYSSAKFTPVNSKSTYLSSLCSIKSHGTSQDFSPRIPRQRGFLISTVYEVQLWTKFPLLVLMLMRTDVLTLTVQATVKELINKLIIPVNKILFYESCILTTCHFL